MANSKRKASATTKITSRKPSNEFGFNLEILFEYLKNRASNEKIEWGLDIDFFNQNFLNGCRGFFGVEVNNIGFPLWDNQEPSKGYLNNFLCWYFLCAA